MIKCMPIIICLKFMTFDTLKPYIDLYILKVWYWFSIFAQGIKEKFKLYLIDCFLKQVWVCTLTMSRKKNCFLCLSEYFYTKDSHR